MNAFSRIVACAVFAVVAGTAFSQPAPGPAPVPNRTEWLKHAGLTDDQVKQVTDILAKHRTDAAPQLAQLKVLNAQIEQAMTGPSPDVKAASALVDKKAQLRADLEKQFLAAQAQIHQVVGDQKYVELKRAFFEHHRRMAMWMHRGGPEGPQGPQQ
jgi:Spy/CpxP family protein refolding chaperone